MPKLTVTAKHSPKIQLLMGDLPQRPTMPSAPIDLDKVADLISTDPHNDLTLGSDDKLLVNTGIQNTYLAQHDW